ncbi:MULTISPECIES: DUF3152 domain-containing protein [unclassified Nocardioides]|uniref:DUF3152 domain-containing protein n=1 Tax=unclassified Nocardioides TaxID=2615069 RepID=UPI0006F628D5|nr:MULTISPECIES: DUF3152 domain-containing protein [unclassified Nocardioides]KQY57391.1 hypothetical protein ASD30_14380 [Nocardioides sp. Root140]KQZ68904.1 hypothetical protein ASD66_16795 [Nocardioides sp. Root151]KRF20419.1 hypothetical protein ASH02_22185 [Nocardioides sp. Soil796]
MTGAHRSGTHRHRGRRAAPGPWKTSIGYAVLMVVLLGTGVWMGAGATLQPRTQGASDVPTRQESPQIAAPGPGVVRMARPMRLDPLVPGRGTGRFSIAGSAGSSTGPDPLRYSVEVEGGLEVAPAVFAQTVEAVLADSRGWRGIGDYEFERVDEGVEVRILLATPATVDELCAPLETNGEVSCRNLDRVVINAKRWFFGAAPFNRPLEQYQQYVINHEVGHALGYPHQACPEAGDPAPVMLQQTLGLQGCTPNPWPVAGPPR